LRKSKSYRVLVALEKLIFAWKVKMDAIKLKKNKKTIRFSSENLLKKLKKIKIKCMLLKIYYNFVQVEDEGL